MEELRRNILASAKKNFLGVGYKLTSLEKIAEDAGLEPSAIRALFQDKRELVEQLMKELSDPFLSAIDFECEDETDVKEFIRKSMVRFNRILADNPDYVILSYRLIIDDPEVMISLMSNYFFPAEFYQRLSKFQEKGEITIQDPMVLESILDAILFFPHISRRMIESFLGKDQIEDYFDNLMDSVMTMFENGLYKK